MMFTRLQLVLGLVVVVLLAVGIVRRYLPVAATLPQESAVAESSEREGEQDFLELDPSDFDDATSASITNEWWPLKPGTRWIHEGFSVEDGERTRHMVVETVTDLTKEINGVKAAVNLEEDYSDGKLIEREIAFHAQDNDGNVWHLGQLRETYDEAEFVGGRVWFVGQPSGAKAGIRMWADPRLGDSASQGYAPAPFNWTDSGRVSQVGQHTTVVAGEYDDVIVVEEWDAETPPGVFQTKYYARGVGIVRIGFTGEDPEQEEMELVKLEQLAGPALTEAREAALAIEERAYVYGLTKPAE